MLNSNKPRKKGVTDSIFELLLWYKHKGISCFLHMGQKLFDSVKHSIHMFYSIIWNIYYMLKTKQQIYNKKSSKRQILFFLLRKRNFVDQKKKDINVIFVISKKLFQDFFFKFHILCFKLSLTWNQKKYVGCRLRFYVITHFMT